MFRSVLFANNLLPLEERVATDLYTEILPGSVEENHAHHQRKRMISPATRRQKLLTLSPVNCNILQASSVHERSPTAKPELCITAPLIASLSQDLSSILLLHERSPTAKPELCNTAPLIASLSPDLSSIILLHGYLLWDFWSPLAW